MEDMEHELSALFPKNSQLRFRAVKALLCLIESGSTTQTQLGKNLMLEPYALNRLLAKLEAGRLAFRRRSGMDNVVSLEANRTPGESDLPCDLSTETP